MSAPNPLLAVDRIDLLAKQTKYEFLVTDHVQREVRDHYPEQFRRLEAAFAEEVLRETSVAVLRLNVVRWRFLNRLDQSCKNLQIPT